MFFLSEYLINTYAIYLKSSFSFEWFFNYRTFDILIPLDQRKMLFPGSGFELTLKNQASEASFRPLQARKFLVFAIRNSVFAISFLRKIVLFLSRLIIAYISALYIITVTKIVYFYRETL